jgi:hypothetical protein
MLRFAQIVTGCLILHGISVIYVHPSGIIRSVSPGFLKYLCSNDSPLKDEVVLGAYNLLRNRVRVRRAYEQKVGPTQPEGRSGTGKYCDGA